MMGMLTFALGFLGAIALGLVLTMLVLMVSILLVRLVLALSDWLDGRLP